MAGSRHALIIANDQYDESGLSRLVAPTHDAGALAEALGDPAVGGFEPRGQRALVNVLFGALLVIVLGSMAGEWASAMQMLDGDLWFWIGHQGYEYVDLGRVWQLMLLVGLANIIMDRARLAEEENAAVEVIDMAEGAKAASDPLADIGVVPAADPTAASDPGKGD